VVTLAIWGEVTTGAILTKCGLWGDIVDVITCAIFRDCRLRGVGVVRGVSLPSPIVLTRRPYNTGHMHYRVTVWFCRKTQWLIVGHKNDTKWRHASLIIIPRHRSEVALLSAECLPEASVTFQIWLNCHTVIMNAYLHDTFGGVSPIILVLWVSNIFAKFRRGAKCR